MCHPAIGPKTKLFCLLGGSVEYTASPAIHNASFKHLGIDAVYLAFSVKNIERALEGLRELGAGGCNVTNPFKARAMFSLDWIEDRAKLVGAVNTVKFDDEVKGFNTDVDGILHSLELLGYDGGKVLLLGAGGAARSAILAVGIKGGTRITIMSRSRSRAERAINLARKLGIDVNHKLWDPFILRTSKYRLIVNATPLGTLGEGKPIEVMDSDCLLLDMVYNPLETPLVKEARSKGCKAIGGLPILIRQASRAEEIWLSVKPDEEIMLKAALAFLGERDES